MSYPPLITASGYESDQSVLIYRVGLDGKVYTAVFDITTNAAPVWIEVDMPVPGHFDSPLAISGDEGSFVFARRVEDGLCYLSPRSDGAPNVFGAGGFFKTKGPPGAATPPYGLGMFAVSEGGLILQVAYDQNWSQPAPLFPSDNAKVAPISPAVLASFFSARVDLVTLGLDAQLPGPPADPWSMLWTYNLGLVPQNHGSSWKPNPFKPWQKLGGIFPVDSLGPGIVSWDNGRLDLFAVGTDNQMYWKFAEGPTIADASAWHPAYPKWFELGGTFDHSAPSVLSQGTGQLDIFGLGAGGKQVFHKSWNSATKGGWTPPHVSWQAVGDGSFTSAPAAAFSGSQRLDVFAVGGNNQVYHNWSENGGVNWQWHWSSIGGAF
jgi:hypothetical protein